MEMPSKKRIFNIVGILLSLVMLLAGILVCSQATQLSSAREFMIGLYLCGFGLFALVLEIKQIDAVTKWCPALETYLGKGFFWIFWGFLLIDGHVGWQILAVLYLAAGVCYICAQFALPGGPIHAMGDDSIREAKDQLDRLDRENAPPPVDPYLSGLESKGPDQTL